ncbi:hypothetical protein ACF3NS_15235 [Arsenicicoccus cauae]|uniref:hypothetical protein n=1 Tax=Arsenicicoccus cauae TaxID=2663847 RepID=UPI00370D02CF
MSSLPQRVFGSQDGERVEVAPPPADASLARAVFGGTVTAPDPAAPPPPPGLYVPSEGRPVAAPRNPNRALHELLQGIGNYYSDND